MSAILPKSRDDWHALRAQHIGGSEIASLFYLWQLANGQLTYLHLFETPPAGATMLGCVSRHTTGYRLYWQKRGVLPTEDLDGNERVMIGQEMEPAIARAAERKWDWKLENARRYVPHPAVAGMAASRDFQMVAPGYPPVEIKNVDFLVFRDLWKAQGDEIEAPPIDITLQVQHQIACGSTRGTASDHGWIVACVGGNRLLRGRIERHDPTIAKIEQAVAAFWAAVAAGTPPLDVADFDTQADLSVLGAEVRSAPLDLTGDNELPGLCAEFLKTDAAVKDGEKLRDRIKGRIALKLGDAPETIRARAAGHSITWVYAQRGGKPYRGAMTIREA
ncbi:YqaJ viral recombinase family protein [Azospirillum argentinense]